MSVNWRINLLITYMKMLLRKTMYWIIWWILWLSMIVPTVTNAQLTPDNPFVNDSDSWSAEKVNVIWSDSWQKDAFINVVRWYANWILWVLWLIALIFVMYGWFLMVTSAWDEEKYKKWSTILRHWIVWLILIGTAWFIVSIVFWLINLTWYQAWWSAWTES